jgi:hypothetical protein
MILNFNSLARIGSYFYLIDYLRENAMLSNFFFLTYGGGQLSIDASTRALRAQQGTLFRIQHSSVDDVKGKGPVNVFAGRQKHKVQMEENPKLLWRPLMEKLR